MSFGFLRSSGRFDGSWLDHQKGQRQRPPNFLFLPAQQGRTIWTHGPHIFPLRSSTQTKRYERRFKGETELGGNIYALKRFLGSCLALLLAMPWLCNFIKREDSGFGGIASVVCAASCAIWFLLVRAGFFHWELLSELPNYPKANDA